MAIVVHERLEDIQRGDWNGLAARAVTATAFQTYEWHRAWLRAFGVAEGLCLVCVYDGERLCAIAPWRRENRHGVPVLKFIGDERSDYADILYAAEDAGVLEEIFRHVGSHAELAAEVELNNIPSGSPTVSFGERLRPATGWRPVWGAEVPCPALVMEGAEGFVQNLLAKKSLRRSEKYYLARGALELRHARDAAAIQGELKDFFTQHIQRWSVRGPQSLFVQRENREFYRRLVEELAPTGRLLFTSLRVAGRPITYHFGFQDGQRLMWYKPSFDLAESEHYPGGLFLKKVIEWGLGAGLAELDFTRGDEFYKTRFANRVRYNRSLTLVRSGERAWLLSLKEKVRRSPALLRTAQAGLAFVRAMRSGRNGRTGSAAIDVHDQYGRYAAAQVAARYGWATGLSGPEAGMLERFRTQLPQMKMLDAGPGIGRTSLYFAPLAQGYTAFDSSPEVVAAAQELVGDYVDPAAFIPGDVRRLPFPDAARFSLVWLGGHALDVIRPAEREAVWREIRRVAIRGAWLCLAAYNLQSLDLRGGNSSLPFWQRWVRYRGLAAANGNLAALRPRLEAMVNDPGPDCLPPVYYVRPREQVRQLEAAGFTEVEVVSPDSGAAVPSGRWDVLRDILLYYCCRVP